MKQKIYNKIFFITCLFLSSLLLNNLISAQESGWHLTNGIKGENIWALQIYQNNPDTVYAAGKYLYYSIDGGENWNKSSEVDAYNQVCMKTDPNNSKIIYGLLFPTPWVGPEDPRGFKISYDGGITWNSVFGIVFPIFIEIDPADNKTVYLCPDVIRYSSDFGKTWDSLNTPSISIIDFRIAHSNSNIFYISAYSGIYKSTNKGRTWEKTAFNSKNYYTPSSVEINPLNPDVVYVLARNSVTGNTILYKTTDGGNNWTELLDTRWVGSFIINPNNPNELFIGLTGVAKDSTANEMTSILYSFDSGQNWIPYGSGIPDSANIWAMDIDATNNRILASAGPIGIYMLQKPTVVNSFKEGSTVGTFKLLQNYPNPFNPSTTIRYSIPEATIVKLQVFDLLGNKITTLVNEFKPAGNYSNKFDASSLPSGIYLYRIEAGRFMYSKKLLLLK